MSSIAQFVVENGRVEKNEDGTFNAASMEVEVEFECSERGMSAEEKTAAVKDALDNPEVK